MNKGLIEMLLGIPFSSFLLMGIIELKSHIIAFS